MTKDVKINLDSREIRNSLATQSHYAAGILRGRTILRVREST